MPKATRIIAAIAAVALSLAGVCGCGGGAHDSSDGVAQIGSTSFTKATVSKWMSTLAGGDFYELAHITAPSGLVSDPPDFSRCAAALGGLAPKLTSTQRRNKCRQLYGALREQAISYVLTAQQSFDEDGELGIHVSEAEVTRALKVFKAELFPTEADKREYLSERDWTPAVERFIVKRDLFEAKSTSKLHKRFTSERALASFLEGLNKKWVAKTSCSPGYVVPQCEEFKASKSDADLIAPATLIQEIAAARAITPTQPVAPDLNCGNKGNGKGIHCERVR
jgi:hypothetical protein